MRYSIVVDWDSYFNFESVASKLEEAGQTIIEKGADILVEEVLARLNIPKVNQNH